MSKKTVLSSKQGAVLSMIPKGMDAARPVCEIAKLVMLDERTVHAIIAELCVKHSIPIVSTRSRERKGVFIATTTEERDAGLSEFKSQVREQRKRISAVEKSDIENWQDHIIIKWESSQTRETKKHASIQK